MPTQIQPSEIVGILLISVGSIAALALLFGVGLAFASKFFAMQTDPRVDQVLDNLPGANCGACGRPGCPNLAEAIVKGESPPDACTVATPAAKQAIARIMGVEVKQKERRVSVLLCSGGGKVGDKFDYNGVSDCTAAALLHGGAKLCSYGCLGLGTCVRACPFNAIVMGPGGLPMVVEERCVACGKCVEACPKGLFTIQPLSKSVHVRCRSCDKGAYVKSICDTGCIGCRKCEKECPVSAIKVENFLAKIDYAACVSCGKCALVCPQGTIGNLRKARKAGALVPAAEAATSKRAEASVGGTA